MAVRQASFCFRRANDSLGQTISQAHLKMEEGRMHRGGGSTGEFLRLFREAVELFRDASQFGNAAFCLEDMNCLEEAGGEFLWFKDLDRGTKGLLQTFGLVLGATTRRHHSTSSAGYGAKHTSATIRSIPTPKRRMRFVRESYSMNSFPTSNAIGNIWSHRKWLRTAKYALSSCPKAG